MPTEPGPELDRAVAVACGFEWDVDGSDGLIIHDVPECRWIQFAPSTDWNDAMTALLRAADGKCYSADYDVNYGIDKRTGWNVDIDGRCYDPFADTGPHAICLAIIKLTEANDIAPTGGRKGGDDTRDAFTQPRP